MIQATTLSREFLLEENARLRAHIDDLEVFAQTIAHDLKNPIATIEGFASLIVNYRDRLSQEDLTHTASFIIDESHRLENMIDSILLFSRVGNVDQVVLEPLNMHAIVENVHLRLMKLITQSRARISFPDDWPAAVGYPVWIEQVWMNYVSNAIKYGGTPPVIRLGADQPCENTVAFWVQDNGSGLSTEQQKVVFQPFTRLAKDKADGSGLGLAIVARIIGKLGGTVDVESSPGSGSTFRFTLPVI